MVELAEPCPQVEEVSYGQGPCWRGRRVNVPHGLLTQSDFPISIIASVDGAGTRG